MCHDVPRACLNVGIQHGCLECGLFKGIKAGWILSAIAYIMVFWFTWSPALICFLNLMSWNSFRILFLLLFGLLMYDSKLANVLNSVDSLEIHRKPEPVAPETWRPRVKGMTVERRFGKCYAKSTSSFIWLVVCQGMCLPSGTWLHFFFGHLG